MHSQLHTPLSKLHTLSSAPFDCRGMLQVFPLLPLTLTLMHVYPLALTPRLYPRIWGGRSLQRELAPHSDFELPLGEIWAVHGDLQIKNGAYAGESLDSLWSRVRTDMAGSCAAERFPLLVKWLDTSDWLSIQVHPDDVQARLIEANPKASGKVECWYVLAVDGPGELICGFAPGVTRADVICGSGSDLLPLVQRQRVKPGDFLFVPAGTIHALGPGITVLEVQQSSDITYRFYDWDRRPVGGIVRPLHIPQARRALLDSLRIDIWGGWRPHQILGQLLTANKHFAQELIRLDAPLEWKPEALEILVVVNGEGELSLDGASCNLTLGEVVLVPAVSRLVRIEPEQPMKIMRVILPTV